MRIFASLVLGLVLATSVRAEAPIEIMILGTYHMGNPGLDIHNMEADDVLSPRRQSELKSVIDGLARFKPTRVAVERNTDDQPTRSVSAYRDFLDGKRNESRNEIDQIAFRLAKKQGLADVYGIDVDGNFPYEEVEAFAKRNGRIAELQKGNEAVAKMVREFNARQRTSSVGELLQAMNTPQAIRDDSAFYMNLLSMGNGSDQPGARLVGEWTMRNLQICARLVQTAKPGDRVVVVYGSGHSSLLRQCVIDMPNWKLVEANDFLPD